MALNAELRKERPTGALPDDSGHVAFFIPEEDFWRLTKGELVRIDWATGKAYVKKPDYPDVLDADPGVARRALARLLRAHPEYCINPNEGKRGAPFKRGVVVR